MNVSVAVAIALHHGRLERTSALRRSEALNPFGGDGDEAQIDALVTEYKSRGKHYAKAGSSTEAGPA